MTNSKLDSFLLNAENQAASVAIRNLVAFTKSRKGQNRTVYLTKAKKEVDALAALNSTLVPTNTPLPPLAHPLARVELARALPEDDNQPF